MRVLIAGAGIGGLTAALSLHAAGIEATVIEGAGELRPLGVGINLLPHTVRELTELGLGDDLANIGVPTAGVSGEEVEVAVLVGADGLHSAVRERLHPGQGPLLWSGVRMWRGVTEIEPFLSGRSMAIARGEGNAGLIAYPIGPSLVNWVAQVGANGASQAIVDAHVLADELARDFPEGLATYEKKRCETTSAIIAANREMLCTGDTRSPEELTRVTDTYRRVTDADNRAQRSVTASQQAVSSQAQVSVATV